MNPPVQFKLKTDSLGFTMCIQSMTKQPPPPLCEREKVNLCLTNVDIDVFLPMIPHRGSLMTTKTVKLKL